MKSLEFCYWLQGLFELDEPTFLNEKQTEIIQRHLEMVFAYDKAPNNYCVFLNGFFKISKPHEINEEQTHVMKKYLDAIFQHEAQAVVSVQTIQKQFEKEQNHSNKNQSVHTGRLLC